MLLSFDFYYFMKGGVRLFRYYLLATKRLGSLFFKALSRFFYFTSSLLISQASTTAKVLGKYLYVSFINCCSSRLYQFLVAARHWLRGYSIITNLVNSIAIRKLRVVFLMANSSSTTSSFRIPQRYRVAITSFLYRYYLNRLLLIYKGKRIRIIDLGYSKARR